ncbi:MAG: aminotransferase class V-fold PLP-dependent enzyme [Acidimicrobiia bacterium]|nr:aminotransferase class V-fold PLP-dependent enzyme [Acidimicrobiia bacterium]
MADSSSDGSTTRAYRQHCLPYLPKLENPEAPESGLLGFGRENMAIPGPSVIPERVLAAMARPMTDIYAGDLVDASTDIFSRLPMIARTSGPVFATIGNGHAAWQMAIDNTLSRGDKVLVLESGRFATLWGEMASRSGVDVEVLPGDDRHPVDPAALQARLEADTDKAFKAVLTVQTDTASGVINDLLALRAAIDAADHPALFLVDCIASIGCEPFEMDAWGVDLTVGASQKGLMVPPGLGFVWAGEKALAAHKTADLRNGYFEWENRLKARFHYELYAGTPPVSHIYAMREALDMIDEQGGIEAVWERHRLLASAVWAAVEAWSAPGRIEFNIIDPRYRSTAVTTIRTGSIPADELRSICRHQAALTVGVGIGEFADRAFRIGHMGYVDVPGILGTLATVEAALTAMGEAPASSGAAAAAAVLGAALRR